MSTSVPETPQSSPPPNNEPAPPVSTASKYEFSESENILIGDLGKKMRFLGMIMVAVASMSLLYGIAKRDPGYFINSVIYIAIGFWMIQASNSFLNVVDTKGDDIRYLMDALLNLTKIYTLLYWMCLIVLIFATIGLVMAMTMKPAM